MAWINLIMLFRIIFCFNEDAERVTFYRELFSNFTLEAVLKTLARILYVTNVYVTNEEELTEDYDTAKAVFDKMTTMMNLQYRDIAYWTTTTRELKLYDDLKDHQPKQEISE